MVWDPGTEVFHQVDTTHRVSGQGCPARGIPPSLLLPDRPRLPLPSVMHRKDPGLNRGLSSDDVRTRLIGPTNSPGSLLEITTKTEWGNQVVELEK